jgi:transcriptional regulator with XRE-family HTH domain
VKLNAPRLYRLIGGHVRLYRVELGATQQALARAAGMTRSTVAGIESGRQRLPIHTLYRLAQALRVRPLALLPPEPWGRS